VADSEVILPNGLVTLRKIQRPLPVGLDEEHGVHKENGASLHCLCDSLVWSIVPEAIERFGRIIVGGGTQVTPETEYVFVTFCPLLKSCAV
jgi:hypothetical protein